MSQPTILKLKFSKTGHASITFRNFLVCKTEFLVILDNWKLDNFMPVLERIHFDYKFCHSYHFSITKFLMNYPAHPVTSHETKILSHPAVKYCVLSILHSYQ